MKHFGTWHLSRLDDLRERLDRARVQEWRSRDRRCTIVLPGELRDALVECLAAVLKEHDYKPEPDESEKTIREAFGRYGKDVKRLRAGTSLMQPRSDLKFR